MEYEQWVSDFYNMLWYNYLCGGPILIVVPIHSCRGWCPTNLVPSLVPEDIPDGDIPAQVLPALEIS